jgi:hypothetical protein
MPYASTLVQVESLRVSQDFANSVPYRLMLTRVSSADRRSRLPEKDSSGLDSLQIKLRKIMPRLFLPVV